MLTRPKTAYSLTCLLMLTALSAQPETCLAPPRPLVSGDALTPREYANLIYDDFETYLLEVQDYFLCLDAERARAFEEAQEFPKNTVSLSKQNASRAVTRAALLYLMCDGNALVCHS